MTDTTLVVETRDDGPALTIALIGRLDSNTVKGLEGAVEELAGYERPAVVFDLERLTYVSSAGLRVFLVAAKQAGGKAVFCGLADNVRKVFEVSGFDHILTLRDTKEEALELF